MVRIMQKNCNTCVYSHWDYETSCGSKRWFLTGCAKDHEDPEEEDCEDWEAAKDAERQLG